MTYKDIKEFDGLLAQAMRTPVQAGRQSLVCQAELKLHALSRDYAPEQREELWFRFGYFVGDLRHRGAPLFAAGRVVDYCLELIGRSPRD